MKNIEEILDYPTGKILKKIAGSFKGRTEIEKNLRTFKNK